MPHVHTLFTPTAARTLAAQLNADTEDGWTYTVVDDPTGRGQSYILIRDEDGAVVNKL